MEREAMDLVQPDVTVEPTGGPTRDERNWAMWVNLAGFAGYTCIPFASIIAPLILWIMKKDQSAYINQRGKLALNFQITCVIYAIVGMVVQAFIFGLLGYLILVAVFVYHLVFTIQGALKASGNEPYAPPGVLPLMK